MELLLNLAWVALSVCALTGWYCFAGRHLSPRDRALQAMALVVLLALLFPVISLTDDLQAAATLAETEHPGRKLLTDHEPVIAPATAFAVLLESTLLLMLAGTAQRIALVSAAGSRRAAMIPNIPERGPPLPASA